VIPLSHRPHIGPSTGNADAFCGSEDPSEARIAAFELDLELKLNSRINIERVSLLSKLVAAVWLHARART
jgi:hypothetical protein